MMRKTRSAAATADCSSLKMSAILQTVTRKLERTKVFVPDRDLKLKANTIEKSVSYENGEIVVRMKSPVFCRSVMVDIVDFREPFSDNYFDLLPNEEKIVTVKADKMYDVTVKSLADIPVKGSKLKTAFFRAKFFVEPENLANWFYYTMN